MPRNVVVAQSGGPSPVINNSLRGVIDACKSFPSDIGRIYGGWHGIEGVLKDELLDISVDVTAVAVGGFFASQGHRVAGGDDGVLVRACVQFIAVHRPPGSAQSDNTAADGLG